MKTILLEVEENSYQTILDFIKQLPKNQCRVINDDKISHQETPFIQKTIAQIQQNDYSEFEDWEAVKTC